jgi:uncharacterized membrane protein YqgA involved in biofilm formation
MLGTALNVLGILAGGIIGLKRNKPLSAANETRFKILLGVFTVWYGLRLTWLSFGGSLWDIAKQFLVMLLALMLGRLLGRLLGLQKLSNQLGRNARQIITEHAPGQLPRASEGLKACAALFCAQPLGIVGSIQDGLQNYFAPLAIKAVIDGLAMVAFVRLFGWTCLLACIPVLAFQGSLSLLSSLAAPLLVPESVMAAVHAVAGMLVFSVSLNILDLKKLELADYLPSLAVAPLLAWLMR